MIDFSDFYQLIAKNRLKHWLYTLPAQLGDWQKEHAHGDFPRWQRVLNKLPQQTTKHIELKDNVSIGKAEDMPEGERKKVESLLRHLHPWRKGPFDIYGIQIDTEWRSDWKWERLRKHISPLKHRYVLDVGCGSGYHMWRMLGDDAEFVVGIDPSTLFLMQFEAIRNFANNDQRVHLLPLGIQELPKLRAFDTVFSMGVLYHRRSPMDHLIQLKEQLHKGGELVLETLVVDGDENQVLVPAGRYGKMPNVWFLPSTAALKLWLEKVGFIDVRVVDVDLTSTEEQRSTSWMTHESLNDYLDPNDKSQTVEGLPAPKRAVLIAINPD
ncbi:MULTISPECIES: tRNA 5-methoxyuridine(34)/uridine 5-oxyacetic acid(34) synthase CmoB [unclassified Agarivorans]|uniref:tRNA 5-methoxyuridine(34)/uridine 5-oxyacetic acid(34) synthase CmoB n=1 Tax=unclassified Agarivorans TaxID=2636026 RepID=UPI0026E3450D|nr:MULTISPECIES: tRNA 5-methoxyuridine(34)/uridine 5-oxyacetic acid(34) synthase CmoB [unclassified Agarivorans]MDO6684772.1 tRNA 5-methoxyuridine(34)/uridine 5-oxyacetic acid(34) synthase CmoB [Agarivorans sp. 3_MG-2023]MDO6715067.1 tRNA 5-methoxyuridine(34)/uridine 5-oxyacetic acid(34) synthase CmoB [Agarivorans sp. 2_MG-2023]MDO6764014.1 tRNA 5-methoxyuridine(34)/uridine 5-oxyacetic acid(34) synthase CmoB [Agarivorans sp. 1_MG-2023]